MPKLSFVSRGPRSGAGAVALLVTALGALAAPSLGGCDGSSSSGDAGSGDGGTSGPTGDAGARVVVRETFFVDGAPAPTNPVTGATTPAEQNRVRVTRYRLAAAVPLPARAIVVMTPGIFAGASSFDGIARALVRRSTEGEALEAWAVDRRSNLLEDGRGLAAAAAAKDVEVARGYYLRNEPVDGVTFGGFLDGASASWMSEWGAAVTVGDLRKVIELVPADARRQRVVLLGHSLGASVAETYAAWDFDGAAGFDDLAALVLVDGVARREGQTLPDTARADYENGPASSGLVAPAGVKAIRAGNTILSFPLFGPQAFLLLEMAGLEAQLAPDAVLSDPARDGLLQLLLGGPVPPLTNRAALGLAFDRATSPLAFNRVSCGAPRGPLEVYTSPLGGELERPADTAITYDWIDADSVSPREATRIADLAAAAHLGPGLNLTEWYFPQRLSLDLGVATTLDVTEGDWRLTEYGLRATRGRSIDVPILGAAFALVGSARAFDNLKALVAPIGPGRPAAGKPRSDESAFRVLELPALEHLDALLGEDTTATPMGGFYDEVAAFARSHTAAGGFVVPKKE